MGENSKIAWTTHTFNPVKGCAKVSEGCKHCYAEADTKRYGLKVWGPTAPRIRTTAENWKKPRRWHREALAAGVRARVFCASWADVGEDHPDWIEPRRDLVKLIEETTALDWLLLTKRPENLVRLFRDAGWSGAWPGHVWAGATVENQGQAERRIPHLLEVPAAVRFLSCEPLLESIDLTRVRANVIPLDALRGGWGVPRNNGGPLPNHPRISWVICGGESGPRARPFDLAWARSLRAQCDAAGAAFFFKQTGARPVDGGAPVAFAHPKGEDPSEWLAELQVQAFPR